MQLKAFLMGVTLMSFIIESDLTTSEKIDAQPDRKTERQTDRQIDREREREREREKN